MSEADAEESDLSFPPLLRGEVALEGTDPFLAASARAKTGADPGLIVHNGGGETLSAALLLAPEASLEDAMAMVFAAMLGLSDSLGALAPPEVAVQMVWPGGVLVNGARCGGFRAAASTADPEAEPDWLVVGFDLALARGGEPGARPDETALAEEGCGGVDPFRLLESWSRHTLVWINDWLETGIGRLHADWSARAPGIGEDATVALGGAARRGRFVGIDERGGMLLRDGEVTTLVPLTAMLEP